jgi:F-type H+-transporting ATPase subunit gamma
MAGSGTMQDIRRRAKSVTSIEHITSAMKLVSAAKLRRARMTFEHSQQYLRVVVADINEIFNSSNEAPSKYLAREKGKKNTCYVVITSNRGLAGSFNSNVIKAVERDIAENRDSRGNPYIIAVGSRGRDYFRRKGLEIIAEYTNQPENITFGEARVISEAMLELFDEGTVDEVVVVYTSFVSSFELQVKTVKILPFERQSDPETAPKMSQVEYEPSLKEVFNYLVPKYVEIVIYGTVVESATCEHASRHMAMENATDNAQAMISDLNLTYNRARQAAITSEITEIVSGADALQ